MAFCYAPMRKAFLVRNRKWAYLQYGEQAEGGIELFDMEEDPCQYDSLADRPEHAAVLQDLRARLDAKLLEIRENDL